MFTGFHAMERTMMASSRRTSALSFLAALLAGLAGFLAFNVIDTVFGVPKAVVGLVAWIALTVFVFRHSAPTTEEPDA
jgi:uncharacterized membrane protein YuzA (DUF378 family)